MFGDYGLLKDTEFSFSYSANDAVVSGEQWEDDANLILKFDLWASQKFSPFLFLQNEKDAIVGLNNRYLEQDWLLDYLRWPSDPIPDLVAFINLQRE